MPRKKAMQSKECSCSPAFMKGPSLSMYEHTLCIQCIIYILNSPQSSLGWQNIVCFLKYIFSQSSRWITWTRRNERHPLTEILLSLSELVWLCMVYTHVRTYELYMDHSFTRKHIPTSQQRVTRPYPEEVALLRSGLRYSAAGYVAVVRAVGHHRILVLRSLSDSLAQYDALCRAVVSSQICFFLQRENVGCLTGILVIDWRKKMLKATLFSGSALVPPRSLDPL